VEQFECLGTTQTNQNCIQEEITGRMKSGNACYHSVQNLLSSGLLSNNVKVKIYGTIILPVVFTRVGTLIVATIYLQLIQNRYMFRSFTVRQSSHQHCVQPVASDVEVVGYL